MGSAKDLQLRPITSREGAAVIRRLHYSGKVVHNSQLHIGVYWRGRLEGALQFGPSLDKRKLQGLVEGTPWNGFLELNRMAFSDALPRNSESRAIAVAMRLLKRHAPHVQWVVSFADAAQCGDGTIYRASGFTLTAIKENSEIVRMPDGAVHHKIVFEPSNAGATNTKAKYGKTGSESGGAFLKKIGAVPVPGYQFRYVYFLDPTARDRLTVPVIPFDQIPDDARMYKGQRLTE